MWTTVNQENTTETWNAQWFTFTNNDGMGNCMLWTDLPEV